ncbi:hypothetical protein M413DRAFT_449566 [Hebeloma cylindrosporum]|uniref:Uncharacterized protein n=1 Tax=Hebeloma cylindrosporum TaxID=76867 RepID=A0A0C3BWS3_HEBCY|nr:hypothetical protein M413DRAFT_449566 [Hebeloma cylindrosporum h7]
MPPETSPNAGPSSSNSPLMNMPSCMTITVSDLSRALEKMGSAEHVSAKALFETIFRIKSGRTATLHSGPEGEDSSGIKPDTESEVLSKEEKRRRMLEMVKAAYASYPDGFPPRRYR